VVTDGGLFEEKTKIKMVFVTASASKFANQKSPRIRPKATLPENGRYLSPAPRAGGIHGRSRNGVRWTITGTLTSKRGTAAILSGYLSADKFNFVINISIGPSFADVTFNGTFDGTSIKGTINVQEFSIDFTGVKPTSNSSVATGFIYAAGDAR